MKVWIVEDCPPYEQGTLIGAARQQYQDFMAVYDQEVLTELPPAPVKRPYQVIP